MRSKKPKSELRKQMSIYVSLELLRKIQIAAKADVRTVSNYIEVVLEAATSRIPARIADFPANYSAVWAECSNCHAQYIGGHTCGDHFTRKDA